MQKQELLNKTAETLSPFETKNIIYFIQNLTMKSAMENPWLIVVLMIVAFYAVVKRSKVVLGTLFTVISSMLLVRYTLPLEPENELTLSSTLPFAFGALVIGAALIYYTFIKTD